MRIIFFVGAMVVSAETYAEEIPRYAPERYCDTVSDAGGGSRMIYNGCLQMEQDAYNALKLSWAALPAKIQSYCDEVARVGGPSYSILKGCIEMESKASTSTREFKF